MSQRMHLKSWYPTLRHRLILRQFRPLDRLHLTFATRTAKLQARWAPLLESKRVYDYVLDRNGTLSGQGDSTLIEYDDVELGHLRVALRHGSSDFAVFDQCLIRRQYRGLAQLAKRSGLEINTILDAGANIGLASLYLARSFPNATVISVEAEAHNFEQLATTVKLNELRNVRPIHAAIWPSAGQLTVSEGQRGGNWSFQVSSMPSTNGGQVVRAVTVPQLLIDTQTGTLDVLKMDIEGAEADVLTTNKNDLDWLKHCKALGIEIHEEDASVRIWSLLTDLGFVVFNQSELTLGFRMRE
jgi:FkbM family methyltransferase